MIMPRLALLLIISALALCGCETTVRTYDAQGNKTWECRVEHFLASPWAGKCIAANPAATDTNR